MRVYFAVVVGLVGFCSLNAADRTGQSIASFLQREVKLGNVTGAQVATGSNRSVRPRSYKFGVIGPRDHRPVSRNTLFCIASCSKPVASSVIFALLDQRKMKLSQNVGELLPEFSDANANSRAVDAPSLKHLLAHRGGIYSQHNNPSKEQLQPIRDFRLTLTESVTQISQQPLTSVPGTKYAYSGAGYCVVGRMAEVATGRDFETLLQENLCEPLQMTRTTYFPDTSRFDEIAEGGTNNFTPPHTLANSLKLPLVGGSIYSTADDLCKWLQMIAEGGKVSGKQILSSKALSVLTGPAFDSQPYGYGWLLTRSNGRVTAVSHKGSLPPYQAAVRINLVTGHYSVVLWTLANPRKVQATTRIRDQIAKLISQT